MIADREAPSDLVFIDGDKPRYSTYLDLSLQLARPGTVILRCHGSDTVTLL